MKITPIQVTIADLTKNYKDDGDGGVFGYDDRLTIRPAYQREFVYKDKQRDLVGTFSDAMKRRQGHKCPFCVKNGIDTEYDFSEMQGDHIIPWSQGGRTVEKIYRCCARDVITIRVTSKN